MLFAILLTGASFCTLDTCDLPRGRISNIPAHYPDGTPYAAYLPLDDHQGILSVYDSYSDLKYKAVVMIVETSDTLIKFDPITDVGRFIFDNYTFYSSAGYYECYVGSSLVQTGYRYDNSYAESHPVPVLEWGPRGALLLSGQVYRYSWEGPQFDSVGTWNAYWPNGRLRKQWSYIGGLRSGPYSEYSPSGALTYSGRYIIRKRLDSIQVFDPVTYESS